MNLLFCFSFDSTRNYYEDICDRHTNVYEKYICSIVMAGLKDNCHTNISMQVRIFKLYYQRKGQFFLATW